MICNIENFGSPNIEAKLMKVKIFSDTPLTNYGGGEIVIIELNRYLTANNVESIVYQPVRVKNVQRVSENYINKIIGTEIKSVDYLNHGLIKFLFHSLPNPEDMDSENVNLVFLYRVPSTQYLKLIKRSGKRVIFCFHGITLERLRMHPFIILSYQLYLRIALLSFTRNINTSDEIFVQVLTDNMQNQLQKYSLHYNKIFKIGNGLKCEELDVGRNDSEFRIVFIGRLENLQKGIKTLKSVIRKSEDIQVIYDIIGSGPDQKLLYEVSNLANITGFLSEELKKSYLLRANLMIITSYMEPYSMVALEGLLSGLPIVSTPVSGPVSIISKNSDYGMISTFNTNDIVTAIKKYYLEWNKDKQLYYMKKVKRRNLSSQEFRADITYYKYLEMIKKVSNRVNRSSF